MRIVVWLAEGTWPAGVDAAGRFAATEAEVILLHVVDPALAGGVGGAAAGLLGRGRSVSDPAAAIAAAAHEAEQALLDAAADLLLRRHQPVYFRIEPGQQHTWTEARVGVAYGLVWVAMQLGWSATNAGPRPTAV